MADRVLVADDDAWILRMVTSILEKRGYEVETATDGEQAFEKALESKPDLLITDVMMPKMDGWSLVRALRARPEFNFMPVIFLTALGSDEDRIRGFRLGADDYLPKPFRFEELDLRISKTMRQRKLVEQQAREHIAGTASERPPTAALIGNLREIGLSVLLTLLEMERKTGMLNVRSEDSAQSAAIYLQDGVVVRADLEDGDDRVLDADCVYRLLEWTSGRFEFQLMDSIDEPRMSMSATQLLMEGAKRIDEIAEAERIASLNILEPGSF